VSAIDVSQATSPVTIDQTGGLISGMIKLSSQADALNVSGGTIAGNIVGKGTSDTVNFALGSGTFTYGSAFGFTGVNQVNVNSGTVILDGTNSATNVTVNSGILEIGDAANTGATLTVTGANPLDVVGGTLAGHGTIAGSVQVGNGGTLMPGGSIGTLTINGNLTFQNGSFYAMALSPNQNSLTNVSGTVTINGGSVVLNPVLGTYNTSKITILTSGGLLSGTFNPTLAFGNSVRLNGTALSYDAHDVFLSFQATTPPTPPGGTPTPPTPPQQNIVGILALPANAPINAQSVVNGLNNFLLAGGTVPAGFQNLVNLSGDALNHATGQLAGQSQGSFAPVGFYAGNMFLNLMLDPHVDGRDAGFGPVLAYAPEQASAPAASTFSALALGPRAFFEPRLSLWASAYGGTGAIAGNATTGAGNTSSQIYGFATGIDYQLQPNTIVGLALGGGGTSWQTGQGLGNGHSGMFQAGAYGRTEFGPAYVSGALAYTLQEVTTSRTVTLAGFDSLQGNFAANVVSGRIETGYRLPYNSLTVTPYAAVQNQEELLPGYSEFATSGSSQFALNYTNHVFSATRTEIGARFDSDIWADKGLELYGRVAWAHDFDNEGTSTALFQSLPGSSFVVNSAKPARDGGLVTAGIEYHLADGWSLIGKFDGEFSPTTAIFAGTATLRKVW
jgi:uncharacterized protein with beta-barrel porin domain